MNRLLVGPIDKTDLLVQLMLEDIGQGLTLIDPIGTLAEKIADRIPIKDTERVFYFNPADVEYPPGLNILDGIEPDDRHRIAEDICAYFEAMWPDSWGPRSSYILLNCLRLLLDTPRATFLGIPKLLTDSDYRTHCQRHCTDPVVLSFWQNEFETWDERFRREAIAPLQNKLGALLTSPVIRNIIGQRHSTFMLDGTHVVIANLDRSKIGDQTAFLLGSLLIARARGRVYINDLGFYASDRLSGLFAQERLTVAVDLLDQLPRKLQQAVLAVPGKTVFKTTREDAERLAFYVGVQNPSILTDLDPSEARNTVAIIHPTATPSLKRLRAVQRRSRACYTRPRLSAEGEVRCQMESRP